MQYQLKKPISFKKRKRVGRGCSSGHGKTCCRGQNGQLSRSGSRKRAWFEGGQMPIQRRVPKRGFNNYFKKNYNIVNLFQLLNLESEEINTELLLKNGIINSSNYPLKILGEGDIDKPITVIADAFSKSAIEKIEKAGGKAVIPSN
ncbi:MAG: 50S ribosomal protein L15 [Spirochaetota bacterium]|nr:50S ribosomal protein L15 [Spirochaetota bacterium]